ncbi:MAG: hypothetical protein HUJ25_14715 [Crocinitomicaceae bacterium]|nr:hypothetical protein [Crocinitomicaceae bacterium]
MKIRIQYSCPEHVENMPKTDCGYFCDACQRNVFDFTGKTEVEIAQITAENPEIKCGVFDSEMVHEDPRTWVRDVFRIAFAAVFVLGFNASLLFGQTKIHYDSTIVQQEVVTSQKIIVKGVVQSGKKGPIKRAVINYYIGKEVVELKVNKEGEFEFELPAEYVGRAFYFDIQARGYRARHYTIDALLAQTYNYTIYLYKPHRMRRRSRTTGFYSVDYRWRRKNSNKF